MSPHHQGTLFALLATALWSGNFLVARDLADTLPPITLAFWRWSLALLVLLPLAWRPARQQWPLIRQHKGYLLLTALLGVTLFNTLIYQAGHSTEAINLSLIAISSPIWLALMARGVLGEPIGPKRGLGLALAFAGVLWLILEGEPARLGQLSFAAGDLWMLLAALIFAAYSLLLRFKPAELSARVMLLATFLPGWLMLLPGVAWEGEAFKGYSLSTWAALAYVGLCASLLAYALWSRAVELIGPGQAAGIYFLMPLFAGLQAAWWLGEPLTWLHGVSATLIIGGIALANRSATPVSASGSKINSLNSEENT
ncbi:DMT family transporter [Ferrimonas marina]|uniref:Permease of the drug/metabolite transporter (DMT) superfamily n=1 Tax=Ferrimonas marina TaxID=299255 RepID=A0A1M5ZFQ1_9GAMM|nr:DMT family transporter [Ferrimonas marina]SHI23040.1 Permease of the drug/metabolite transporter (DMT) superfamily [Ferrimonas marina]